MYDKLMNDLNNEASQHEEIPVTQPPLDSEQEAALLVIIEYLTSYWFLPEKSQRQILTAMVEFKKKD